jgi:putative transposase
LSKPTRIAFRPGESCFFITAPTHLRNRVFQVTRNAALLLDVLQHYRKQGEYLLHEFVIMPDHLHLLISPNGTLERAMQMIKGGFSFRMKKELNFSGEVWQRGFTDHRVRDEAEYLDFRTYIFENPVKARLVTKSEEYPFSSAHIRDVDPNPFTSAAKAAAK